MEKVQKVEQRFVKIDEVVERWQTVDGKLFEFKKDAEAHEKFLKVEAQFKALKFMEFPIGDEFYEFVRIENKTQYDLMLAYYGVNDKFEFTKNPTYPAIFYVSEEKRDFDPYGGTTYYRQLVQTDSSYIQELAKLAGLL